MQDDTSDLLTGHSAVQIPRQILATDDWAEVKDKIRAIERKDEVPWCTLRCGFAWFESEDFDEAVRIYGKTIPIKQ